MTRPNLNAVAILPKELEGAIGSTGFFVLRSPYISPHWLYYLVQTREFIDSMSSLVSGVLYPAVRPRDIVRYQFQLPPLPEQQRIVGEIEKQFTRLDAALAALKRVRSGLKHYRVAVLKAASEGRLLPTEAELARKDDRSFDTGEQLLLSILKDRRVKWEADQLAILRSQRRSPENENWKNKYKEPLEPETHGLPSIPDGWQWACMDQLLHRITAGKSFRCEERPPKDNEFGVVKVSSVTWGEFDEEESKTCLSDAQWIQEYQIKPGDFLFSRANTLDLVGACVIVREVRKHLMLSDKILRFVLTDLIPHEWVLTILRSPWGRHEIERLATGNQESMRNIGQDRIRRIRVPCHSGSDKPGCRVL